MRVLFLADNGHYAQAEIADEDLLLAIDGAHNRAVGQPGRRSSDPEIRELWQRRARSYDELRRAFVETSAIPGFGSALLGGQ